jgi:hypothetical protein
MAPGPRPLFPMAQQPAPGGSGGGVWDWLQSAAFQQNPSFSPDMLKQAGVTPTSRLQAIGQALMGFGSGVQNNGRGLLAGLAGGAMGAAQGYRGAETNERQQTMESLIQQAQIAKMLRPEAGQTSEFERLAQSVPPDQRQKLVAGRLDALASENKPPTWRPATPEEQAKGIYQVNSLGEAKMLPGEFVTSDSEAANLALRQQEIQAQRENAAAARENAAAARGMTLAQFASSEAGRAFDKANRERDDVASLRKEFDAKPEVTNYKVILPTIKSAVEAAGSRGPGSDLEFVYAVGKILDPASAVREGEQAAIANSQSPANILSGYLDWVTGGNKLTEEQRNQLLQIMDRRARQAHDLYKGAVDTFSSYATENYGVDPSRVVRDIGAPPELPKFGDKGPPGDPTSLLGEVWGP